MASSESPIRRLAGPMLLLLCLFTVVGCSRKEAALSQTGGLTEAPFVERAAELGLQFVHVNGAAGEMTILEVMGAGCALLDYDNDGDLDAYLVQGIPLGPAPTPTTQLGDRLFRNELVETGRLHFSDVTQAAGLSSIGYGMGAAAGDYDNDGDLDLYITRFGPSALLRNDGGRTFSDVTAASGTREDRWSSSAAFVDYDRDGWLDLFVANYVDFTLDNDKVCYSATSARDYCGPLNFKPHPSRLFRNLGNGTFQDVTEVSQIARHDGPGLGVIATDLNADGRVDIFVANDARPNLLWINQDGRTFRDEALLAGCALNEDGQAEAGMGVDAGDYDNDGDEDLFITHLTGETNTLYNNDGKGLFEDYTAESGLGPPSLPFTGFGTAWIDYDNDGWLDLIVANGSVKIIPELAQAGDPFPLHEIKQIFHNRGDGRFDDVTRDAGAAFELSEVGRGAAFGDIDNDGDTDVLVTNNNGPARLLLNQVGQRNHWLGLRMLDRAGKTDALGTEVELVHASGAPLRRRVHVDGSYLSSSDPRVLFGLGAQVEIRTVRARWPDGTREEWSGIAPDRYLTLRQGSGRSLS